MRTFSRSKTWCGIEAFVVAVLTCGVPAFGQAPTGAQKAAAAWSTAVVFGPIAASSLNSSSIKATPFQDLLVTRIKPPGGKDLLVNVSMETGIFAFADLTDQARLAVTEAQLDTRLQVRVLIDCPDCAHPYADRPAEPGMVNFDNLFRMVDRVTSSSGFDFFGDRVNQLGVRTFAFVARDVDVGIHTIRVQARFVAASSSLSFNGKAEDEVLARIGARSVTVEEVKLDAQ